MDAPRKRRIALALAAVALLAVAAVAVLRLRGTPDDGVVRVAGNIEVTRVDVAFRVPGRLVERRVDEGMSVAEGEPVARLDASDLEREVGMRQAELQVAEAALRELTAGSRPQEIARARAEVDRAQARLSELEAGSRPQEIETAKAALASAEAEAARLAKDYARYEELFRREIVARQAFDAAKAAHEVSRARAKEAAEALRLAEEGPRREQIAQARAALAAARETWSLLVEGPRREAIDQARGRARQAREGLELARTRLSYAAVASPLAGVVLSKNVEPGDYLAAGAPVVTVGDLHDVWLRGYVEETDLGRVKLGQPAVVTTDTFPGKRYAGRVSFIASEAEFTPKTVQTRKERVKLVYRVKIDVPNPERELLPGMPAEGIIRVREGGATGDGGDSHR
jgi:membrane fusion protein YbhG